MISEVHERAYAMKRKKGNSSLNNWRKEVTSSRHDKKEGSKSNNARHPAVLYPQASTFTALKQTRQTSPAESFPLLF
jgi:hypothetical protein